MKRLITLLWLPSFMLISLFCIAVKGQAQTIKGNYFPKYKYSHKICFNKPNTDRKLIFCEDLLTGIDSKLRNFSYTIIETHASIHFKETTDSISIIIYDFIDDCANEYFTKQFHDIEFMDILAAGVYNQAYACRVFSDKKGFSAVCFKGLMIDESIISVELSNELITFVRENLCQRILVSKSLMKNAGAKYKYCHQSGDTLRTLHTRGLVTNTLYFALYEKVGKKSFGLIAKGRAKMTSDSEQDENAEGEPVFSQEYRYNKDGK